MESMRGRSYVSRRAARCGSAADAARDPGAAGGLEDVGGAVARGALPLLRDGLGVDHLTRDLLLEVEAGAPQVLVDDLGLGVPAARARHPLLGRRGLLLRD